MSPMHDNRYVVLVTSGRNASISDRIVNGTIRATEILDYTIPDASWEESKDFILLYIPIYLPLSSYSWGASAKCSLLCSAFFLLFLLSPVLSKCQSNRPFKFF